MGDEEADPLKVVGVPGDAAPTVNAAVGAWSGVMAIPAGSVPTPIGAPAVFEAVAIGVTVAPNSSET